jgi:hypothetical protein
MGGQELVVKTQSTSIDCRVLERSRERENRRSEYTVLVRIKQRAIDIYKEKAIILNDPPN